MSKRINRSRQVAISKYFDVCQRQQNLAGALCRQKCRDSFKVAQKSCLGVEFALVADTGVAATFGTLQSCWRNRSFEVTQPGWLRMARLLIKIIRFRGPKSVQGERNCEQEKDLKKCRGAEYKGKLSRSGNRIRRIGTDRLVDNGRITKGLRKEGLRKGNGEGE